MREPSDPSDILLKRPPEAPRFRDWFVDWWREIRSPIEWDFYLSPRHAIVRRVLLWIPVFVVMFVILGGIGFYLFTGWRARDLARRAQQSIKYGELRYALIQAESARSLRRNDPQVLRAYAAALTAVGDARSLQAWERLAGVEALTREDLVDKAAAAARLGTDEQFKEVVDSLDAAGRPAEADVWRGRRALQQRDFTNAEKYLRSAVKKEPTAEMQIELARLLATINTKESIAEAVQIIASMADGPDAGQALAFALSLVPAGPATRLEWAEKSVVNLSADNEALLPAAGVLIDDRHRSLEDIIAQFEPVFVDAPLEKRGIYARWLLDRNRPGEALGLIYPGEARGTRGAFLVRAEALSAVGDWQGLSDLIDAGSPLSEPATYLLKARADEGLKRASVNADLEKAIRTAVPRMMLPEVLAQVDAMGKSSVGDRVLLELCGEHGNAEYALRVARWRFSQRGEPRLRQEACRQALKAVPNSATVQDLQRLERLLAREPVDPSETEKVLAGEPANVDFRLTHALALLAAGRPAEARIMLEPCEAIRHQLQPGQKAVVVAVLAATGSRNEAVALARTMKSAHLTDAEYRLVYELTTSDKPEIRAPHDRADGAE